MYTCGSLLAGAIPRFYSLFFLHKGEQPQ